MAGRHVSAVESIEAAVEAAVEDAVGDAEFSREGVSAVERIFVTPPGDTPILQELHIAQNSILSRGDRLNKRFMFKKNEQTFASRPFTSETAH